MVSSAERTSAPRQLRIFSGLSIQNINSDIEKKTVVLFCHLRGILQVREQYLLQFLEDTMKACLVERWLVWPGLWKTGDGFWS